MKSAAKSIVRPAPPADIAARVDAIDWAQATRELDAQGCAVLKGLLLCPQDLSECANGRFSPTARRWI
jgi:hypothetical protein